MGSYGRSRKADVLCVVETTGSRMFCGEGGAHVRGQEACEPPGVRLGGAELADAGLLLRGGGEGTGENAIGWQAIPSYSPQAPVIDRLRPAPALHRERVDEWRCEGLVPTVRPG
jgi:hypothetical protein